MAELALGSIELAIKPRSRPGQCSHEANLSVTAAGVKRSICETCGHISVRFLTEMSGPIYRRRFARPADEAAESPQVNPFAEEGRLGLRRRESADQQSLLLIA